MYPCFIQSKWSKIRNSLNVKVPVIGPKSRGKFVSIIERPERKTKKKNLGGVHKSQKTKDPGVIKNIPNREEFISKNPC